jgi:hypothetical protein
VCNDHHSQPTRRQVLYGAGALAAAAVAAGRLPRSPGAARRLPLRSPDRANRFFGDQLAYSMAMHIHSSFSEQTGSMESQFFQAESNCVDVLWLTDHDHRMEGNNYRNTVHFTSLTSETGGTGQGGAWTWAQRQSGPVPAGSAGGIVTSPSYDALLASTIIPGIHAAGGLASYNHPFGFSDVAKLPQATQDSMLAQLATQLLGNNALDCDVLEVGYNLRQGVDLAHHLSLWNIMSRNAVFLTGNGVSDDHFGLDWTGITNNWTTSAWAASPRIPDLTAALAAGRAWCGSLAEFGPGSALDLVADRCCPMGSATVSSLTQRRLTLCATAIPAGGAVRVLRGEVDYAGTADPSDNTQVIASYADTDLARSGGLARLCVDTSSECFALLTVTNATGATVAVSNPVWMLHDTPPDGIPAPRQA